MSYTGRHELHEEDMGYTGRHGLHRKVPEISSESFFMPSSVAMVTAAVRAEFHSSPASSMLSSEMAICVILPK